MVKYIKGLDGLRAFAVAFVIIAHWRNTNFLDDHSLSANLQKILIPEGSFGVDLFFVLSGFLISSILLKAKEENKHRLLIIKNFIIRRTLRIFPIYYLTLIILFAINYPDIRQYFFWFFAYASNFLCYRMHSWNSFSHSWSLSIEEQFYLIWPWLIIFLRGRNLKYLFIVFILIGPISSFISVKYLHSFFPLLTPNCFDSFGIGGLYAFASGNKDSLQKFRKTLSFLLPIAVVIYFCWKLAPVLGHVAVYSIYFQRIVDSIIAIAIIDKTITTKLAFLENPVLVSIGKISYGVYLFHYPIGVLIDSANISSNFYFVYAIKLTLLLLISYCSYYFFESKIIRLKKRFEY